jgi:hypothetical protein
MIGVITADGIPLAHSAKARIRRIFQKRVFARAEPQAKHKRAYQECQREGMLTLKTYVDLQSMLGDPLKEIPIALRRYEIDDSFFGSCEFVIVEHGFSCAGMANHGECFDPWGPHALARLALNLLQTGGLIAIRNEGEHIAVHQAFWPSREQMKPCFESSTSQSMFQAGRWTFLTEDSKGTPHKKQACPPVVGTKHQKFK